jgi:hypothetical protein
MRNEQQGWNMRLIKAVQLGVLVGCILTLGLGVNWFPALAQTKSNGYQCYKDLKCTYAKSFATAQCGGVLCVGEETDHRFPGCFTKADANCTADSKYGFVGCPGKCQSLHFPDCTMIVNGCPNGIPDE